VWFRKGEDKPAAPARSRATAYRYVAEGIKVLTAQAPDPHARNGRRGGLSHDLDGKLFHRPAGRDHHQRRDTIDAWYPVSTATGANIQPSSARTDYDLHRRAMPGHLHD
jgi:hypothetical protein